MSVPLWRDVKYTDDGCNEFQCLNCYTYWESRTSPSCRYDKKFWRFCPYCGCEWAGCVIDGNNKWHRFYYSEKYDRHSSKSDIVRKQFVLKYWNKERKIWEKQREHYFPDRICSAIEAKKHLNSVRAQVLAQHRDLKEDYGSSDREFRNFSCGFVIKYSYGEYKYKLFLE